MGSIIQVIYYQGFYSTVPRDIYREMNREKREQKYSNRVEKKSEEWMYKNRTERSRREENKKEVEVRKNWEVLSES